MSSETPALYPITRKKKSYAATLPGEVNTIPPPPISGLYLGHLDWADLDLKIDVDKLRDYSSVLNIVSGSIAINRRKLPWGEAGQALYFRSVDGSLKVKREENGIKKASISVRVRVTRSDGKIYRGYLLITLQESGYGDWSGSLEIKVETKSVTFNIARKSEYFRQIGIDIDYLDQVVLPQIYLDDYHDTQKKIKGRKVDVFTALEDAGVKLLYDEDDSDKIEDPTPYNPWTKDDMYNVMEAHFDGYEGVEETIWCMVATDPPDERFMGYSFQKNERHGFGIFTGHKSFEGLLDQSHENHGYAKRKFLHYFVHECGHCFGIPHPFETGKPNALTWLNYAWKYDDVNGPGTFYENFQYSFTNDEQTVIRHSPSKAFNVAKSAGVQIGGYGVVKSLPADVEDDEDDEKDYGKENIHKLSLILKVQDGPYSVGNLVDLEVRVKNEGEVATLAERELDLENGNLIVYLRDPNGSVKKIEPFVRSIPTSNYMKPLLLYPKGDTAGPDRYSQLVSIGEGKYGPVFDEEGEYLIRAVYVGGRRKTVSNIAKVKINGYSDQSGYYKSSVNTAYLLGDLNHERYRAYSDEWKQITSLPVEEKKSYANKLTYVGKSISKKKSRGAVVGTKKGKNRQRKSVKQYSGVIGHKDYLKGTDDLVQYYHDKGTKKDNLAYKSLVYARGKILKNYDFAQANTEYNQLLSDLVSRGLKYPAVKYLTEEWKELQAPKDAVEDRSTSYYQKRVEEILDWYPTKRVYGPKDLSGIGLGVALGNFQESHIKATGKIVKLLLKKLDETKDLNEVLDYADNLQHGYQVNHQVLQLAVEIFIVHNKEAKKSGIQYPLPKDRDDTSSYAAMTVTKREGEPTESWMNYWRNDAELNYHHRHWHAVYVGIRTHTCKGLVLADPTPPQLLRQGELFMYMHHQMLARYNAERESWDLDIAQPWKYNDVDTKGYNAGFEFHNDPRNYAMAPRTCTKWPKDKVHDFNKWKNAYESAVESGKLPPKIVGGQHVDKMDFNYSGHVVEATSLTWDSYTGSIHNRGHNLIATMVSRQLLDTPKEDQVVTYMYNTATAIRDPIFFRWHTHIDDLWQDWNNRYVTEIAEDAPPVQIRSCDIIIRKTKDPLQGFRTFECDSNTSDEMTTILGPPEKLYEWDYKLKHEPFYYHIRFKRTNCCGQDLNLTLRVFICPTKHVNDRKRWIEMDKFVVRLDADKKTHAVIRPGRHSSVIKRDPNDKECGVDATQRVDGFCECGWPYNMLLPRGTACGEKWTLCVFASNNDIDSIKVHTDCGGLSFCGASGRPYPDRRVMGYPFTTDMTINGVQKSITDSIDFLGNASISSFVIRNNVTTSPPTDKLVDMWSPWKQLGVDDGIPDVDDSNLHTAITDFRPTTVTNAWFYVVIDEDAISVDKDDTADGKAVRFSGRGIGNGIYTIQYPTIEHNTAFYSITSNGQNSFDVPEEGIVSDITNINYTGGSFMMTFKLCNPGTSLRRSRMTDTNTLILPFNSKNKDAKVAPKNPEFDPSLIRHPSIFCVQGIETNIKKKKKSQDI